MAGGVGSRCAPLVGLMVLHGVGAGSVGMVGARGGGKGQTNPKTQ